MTPEVRECLAEMGVTEEVFAKIRACSNHTDGEKALDEAKQICKAGFRVIATKYHPDHNQHLPSEELKTKEERFKRLRSIHDSFLESRYRGPQRAHGQRIAVPFDPFKGEMSDLALMDLLRNWHRQESERERIAREREERRRQAIEILLKNMPKK
jgi:DnaJ-class molecular chaperone